MIYQTCINLGTAGIKSTLKVSIESIMNFLKTFGKLVRFSRKKNNRIEVRLRPRDRLCYWVSLFGVFLGRRWFWSAVLILNPIYSIFLIFTFKKSSSFPEVLTVVSAALDYCALNGGNGHDRKTTPFLQVYRSPLRSTNRTGGRIMQGP